jgi:hypothetical protein
MTKMQGSTSMQRRTLLATMGAAGAAAFLPRLAFAQKAGSLADAARDAYVYCLPLIEMARARASVFAKGQRPNHLQHASDLITPQTQDITTPNRDTIYSSAWCDTAQGPISFTLPATGRRYLSFAFLDFFTNHFAVLGTRTNGGDGGEFTLVGPDSLRSGPNVIRSPTRWTLLIVRLMVEGPDDMQNVRAIQQRMKLEGTAAAIPPTFAARDANWRDVFASAQALIVENGVPATDGELFRHIAPLGIGPTGGFDPQRFTDAQSAEIERGIAEARNIVRAVRGSSGVVDGWAYPKADIGMYGQDYLYRAQIALGGLGALPRIEAMYMRPLSEKGLLYFEPNREARLHFPAERLPPVDGFWSATMYQFTEAGQLYFVENDIHRYVLSDRTPGLVHNPDKSLDIWMTADRPAQERVPNWLPLPRDKRWSVVFRAYLPRKEMLEGAYRLPPLTLL